MVKMLTAGTHILTNPDKDSLNHCILVKLTDTSAKYIQEFIKRNVGCDRFVKLKLIIFKLNKRILTRKQL